MRRGVTMILPGETEAGSAGMQPCRGIAWWAHRDDDQERGNQLLALRLPIIGSKDPDALKIPARRAEFTLTEDASSPVHAEPEHKKVVRVFDYVDAQVPMLARMYEKRLQGYRAIGYEMESAVVESVDTQSQQG